MPGARRIAVLIMLVLGVGVLPVASLAPAGAAPDDGAFTKLSGFKPSGAKVRVRPESFSATRVDIPALKGELPTGAASAVVSVPDPSGAPVRFRVQRTQIMESKLAAAHPELATYSGRGVDDPLASISLDLTPMGFHASVRAPGGQRDWYVDPAYNGRGTTQHLSYYGADLPAAEQRRREGEIQGVGDKLRDATAAAPSAAAGAPIVRKVYRLALTSDPTYALKFGASNVLSEKVTLMNRVNQVYNDDLAITMRLVNATDSLNFDTDAEATGPDGPCGSAPCFSLYDDGGTPDDESDDVPGGLDYCDSPALGENRNVLGLLVGASNYDIGHLALGVNGGGVAFLGVVGGDYKASGCTGLPDPRGDLFAIDYVAHEMGHQFAGNHTFNGTQSNCSGGNRESITSVEPGSGSSVMAYAGICRQDNLQAHSDPYFSQRSVDEVTTYTSGAPASNYEVQTVSLRDFSGTDSLQISYDGSAPVSVTRGSTYNAAGVEAAIEAATGADVSVVQWDFDEEGYRPDPTEIDDRGFQVIFNEAPFVLEVPADAGDVDYDALTVTGTGATTLVGETAKGGPSDNGGGLLPEPTNNLAPSVTAPADKTLPMRTPFALTGSGTDGDGDPLLYLWEQNDDASGTAGTALVSNTKIDGPLFRVFGKEAKVSAADSLLTPSPGENLADGSPTRVFPDLAQVLSGNTNAATGVCPTAPPPPVPFVRLDPALVECYSEYLPKTGYLGTPESGVPAMHFRLTARDLYPTGGGLAFDDVTLRLDPTAGPFQVTSQATPGATVAGGTSVPVTWAVNNTQGLAPTVKITASTDGGATFGSVLAAATPNDGSEALTMPNVTAADVRIKIEAVGNYFFDVNDASFKLAASPAPNTTITEGPDDNSVVLEKRQTFDYASSSASATFVCTVDDATVPCGAGGKELKFRAGTHLFGVSAVNAAGVADATPATRTFTVPIDDGQLVKKGDWRKVNDKRAYGNDYVTSSDKGDKLITRIRQATAITLVVSTRKNAGPVKLFVGNHRVKTFSLQGKNRVNRLRAVVFDSPESGKLKVVVGKNKPVRIEGVAVVTDPS
ncbi:reprolysin-like metallopeptidase [Nocardioides sp. InS609-2]|uniref:reprolysin-like metallopeptidase n=1 Tax=Nocardioides sp. InS609-2 TaxID=2760705 RepID=UPI0020BFDE7B|nr:M12 family metallo-peptidase [Nocardioides sp. InS609-2]